MDAQQNSLPLTWGALAWVSCIVLVIPALISCSFMYRGAHIAANMIASNKDIATKVGTWLLILILRVLLHYFN